MYLDYFGLSEYPFGLTPDTAFVCATTAHQEALNTLLLGLRAGEGFLKITGEVGTGKTLLCRRLLAALAESHTTAFLPNPSLDRVTLFKALLAEMRVRVPADADEYTLLQLINRGLIHYAEQARPVVLCLDEAQTMSEAGLEALRLLSNLETEKRKLLQLVLFGQPELDQTLQRESLRQLLQRITFQYTLTGLQTSELPAYLVHRLDKAGYQGESPFSRRALKALYQATDGTPRLVNVLAHKTLLTLFGEGRRRAERRHIRLAAQDTPGAVRVPGRFF